MPGGFQNGKCESSLTFHQSAKIFQFPGILCNILLSGPLPDIPVVNSEFWLNLPVLQFDNNFHYKTFNNPKS